MQKKTYFWASLCLSLIVFSCDLWALGLEEARSRRLVCERMDGYLQALSAEAQSLVSTVNAQRRAQYEGIARERGVSLEDVAAIAGKDLQSKGGC